MVKRFHIGLILFGIISSLLPTAVASSSDIKNGFQLENALVPAKEIHKGGPPRDGIPSLDNPRFIPAGRADYLKGKDRVLGVSIDGIARAYPIRILNYHEIVNDTVGRKAVVITYCPLCGSGTLFFSTIGGRRFEFGVSGLLYNSDVLMYDRQTDSLWSQLMSQAISGRMKGERLVQLPVSHTSWQDWLSRHPETTVLSDDTGFRRNYRMDPYPNYGRDGRLYFPVSHSSNEYGRKEPVMGLELTGKFKAYAFKELRKGAPRFKDEVGGIELHVEFDKEHETARILNADGDELPTTIAYWFAWYAFHPDTEVYKTPQNDD